MRKVRNAHKKFGRKNKPVALGAPRLIWEDNIRRVLREIEWEGVEWICLAQDRDKWRILVNTIMNLQVP
jgi:hypothetical protein